jgi:hypothetical protein
MPFSEAGARCIPWAISVYLERFVNVPAARLPGEGGSLGDVDANESVLLARFLELLDQRPQVAAAARLVAQYLRQGYSVTHLVDVLTRAVVREDADFHTFQMVEVGVRQYQQWEGEHILVAGEPLPEALR